MHISLLWLFGPNFMQSMGELFLAPMGGATPGLRVPTGE